MQSILALHVGRMDAIYALLFFATVIAIIYLAGRWNPSDVDHYMGFDNLRSPVSRRLRRTKGTQKKNETTLSVPFDRHRWRGRRTFYRRSRKESTRCISNAVASAS